MKIHRKLETILLITLMAVPMMALGATSVDSINSGLSSFGSIIGTLTSRVVTALSTLAATAAMVVFFYGIVQYIWGIREGDEQRVTKGNLFLRWGLVALFVMFSVWGIIIYVQKIFGIDQSNNIVIPTIQLGGTTQTNQNPLAPANSNSVTPASVPDGTPYWRCNGAVYYNEADYLKACPGSSSSAPTGTQSSGSGGVGADCTTPAECQSGLTCPNFTCQQSSAAQTSGSGGVGADCTTAAECRSGLVCPNFSCQASCGTPGAQCPVGGFIGQCGVDGVCRAGGSR